jgi:hypothetical protein
MMNGFPAIAVRNKPPVVTAHCQIVVKVSVYFPAKTGRHNQLIITR